MLTAVLTAEVRHVAVAVAAASSRCERGAAYRGSAAGLLREQRGATARRWFGAPAIGRAGAAAAAPARMVRSMRASTATSASDSAVPHRAAAAFDAGDARRPLWLGACTGTVVLSASRALPAHLAGRCKPHWDPQRARHRVSTARRARRDGMCGEGVWSRLLGASAARSRHAPGGPPEGARSRRAYTRELGAHAADVRYPGPPP